MVSKISWSVALSCLILMHARGDGETVFDIVDVLVRVQSGFVSFKADGDQFCHIVGFFVGMRKQSGRSRFWTPGCETCQWAVPPRSIYICAVMVFFCFPEYGTALGSRFLDGDLRGMPMWQSVWFYGIVLWCRVQECGVRVEVCASFVGA